MNGADKNSIDSADGVDRYPNITHSAHMCSIVYTVHMVRPLRYRSASIWVLVGEDQDLIHGGLA